MTTFRVMAVVILALISGCARWMIHSEVDAISSGDFTKKTYILAPGNEGTDPEDLLYQEFTLYVHRALADGGFIPATTLEEANTIIFLGYGIGEPKEHTYSYSYPVVGQTGYSSATTSMFGGSATTYFNPSYGVTGFATGSGSYTTHLRYMILDAFDLNAYRQTKKTKKIWRTTVTSEGSTDDLRLVFPYLVSASKEYLGSNTGQKVTVSLTKDDRRVLEIKEPRESYPKR